MVEMLLIMGLIVNLIGLYVVYRRVGRADYGIRDEIRVHSGNTILQIESVMGLYAEIAPRRALPRTRGWAASPDLLAFVMSIVRERKPATVIECSSGLSTLVIAASLRNAGGGRVYSLEHDPDFAAQTRAMLTQHGLNAWAEVLDAPLIDTRVENWSGRWYDLNALDPSVRADLLVIDGPPTVTGRDARFPALPKLRSKLKPGAMIVLDDADRSAEQRAVQSWLSTYPELKKRPAPKCEKGCVVLSVDETV